MSKEAHTNRLMQPKQQHSPLLIEELNRGYVCPEDAGPAWRGAYEAGIWRCWKKS